MNLRNIFYIILIAACIGSGGCGLFASKEKQKSEQQVQDEQRDLRRKVDSLKNLKLDRELDSLKIVLDSSSKNLDETMQKILKSDEMKKDPVPKVK